MGIYLKGNVYWMIKVHKGKKVERSLYTSKKREAEQRFSEILPTIIDGSYFEQPKLMPTVQEVMDRYIKEISPQHLGHHRNIALYEYWCSFLGDGLTMDKVTKSLLSKYKAQRLTGELKHGKRMAGESTVKKELSFLRQVINFAIEEWDEDWDGYFQHYVNPVKRVIKGMREGRRVRYLSPDEAVALSRELPSWLFDMVIVFCETGLRRAKLVELRKSQIDFIGGWINFPQKLPREKGVQPVKMTKVVREHLIRIMKRVKPDSDYVFTDDKGQPHSLEKVSMAFGRARKAAGIHDLRLHDLRHDFATRLINAGASLYQVQHQLAHSDPRITQRYAHLLPENQNVVERIDGKGTTTILLQSKKEELPDKGNSLN